MCFSCLPLNLSAASRKNAARTLALDAVSAVVEPAIAKILRFSHSIHAVLDACVNVAQDTSSHNQQILWVRPVRTCCPILPTESNAGVAVAVPMRQGGCLVLVLESLVYTSTNRERDTNLCRCRILLVASFAAACFYSCWLLTTAGAAEAGLLGPAVAPTLLGTVIARVNEVKTVVAIEGTCAPLHVLFLRKIQAPRAPPPRSPAYITKSRSLSRTDDAQVLEEALAAEAAQTEREREAPIRGLAKYEIFSFVLMTSVGSRPFHYTDLHRRVNTNSEKETGNEPRGGHVEGGRGKGTAGGMCFHGKMVLLDGHGRFHR